MDRRLYWLKNLTLVVTLLTDSIAYYVCLCSFPHGQDNILCFFKDRKGVIGTYIGFS